MIPACSQFLFDSVASLPLFELPVIEKVPASPQAWQSYGISLSLPWSGPLARDQVELPARVDCALCAVLHTDQKPSPDVPDLTEATLEDLSKGLAAGCFTSVDLVDVRQSYLR